jgi:serine/threonine-protein kinase
VSDLPTAIAHFRVTRKLGAGGMGVVYEAHDEKLRRTVALKVLPPEYTKNEERRSRFLREARSAAAVTHANIATVYEVGEDGDRIYIVMELVEGVTLRKKLAGGALTVRETVTLGKQIAKALARAHEKGVIHRDLKPDNVMVTKDGEVKLLDFGLAKLREVAEEGAPTASVLEQEETSSHVTQEGRVLGTPGYMSPEQATGKPVDRRTDLFSLGVVLYEMLSGARPFGSGSTMEVIIATSRDEPKPIAELAPDAPEELCAIVNRCLAKSAADRYETAASLVEALDGVAVDTSGSKPGVPAPRRSDRDVAAAKSSASKTPEGVVSLSSAGHVAPASPKRSPTAFLIVVAALVLAGLAIAKLSLRAPSADQATSASASSSAKPATTSIVDLPKPTACTPEGMRHLEKGLNGFRVGGWDAARRAFEEGIKVDPSCPELNLRVAMVSYFGQSATRARETYRAVLELRAKLSPRDQAIVDALEPIMGRDPPDPNEANERFRRLVDRYPLDAEILNSVTGYTRVTAEERKAYCERAVAIDPDYADARQGVARAKIDLGDLDGARQDLAECIRRTPAAVDCILERVALSHRIGACDDMEAAARLWTARDPAAPTGYQFLAQAITATGASRDEIARTIDLSIARSPPDVAIEKDHFLALLDVGRGDFGGAHASLDRLGRSVADSPDLNVHVRHDLLAVELLVEAGQDAAAAKAAADFLGRKRVWRQTTNHDMHTWSVFAVPRMLAIAAQPGGLPREKRVAERDAWAAWAKPTFRPADGWAYASAITVETAEDAVDALKTMPPRAKIAPWGSGTGAWTGRALMIAGRHAEAIAWLEDAAKRCDLLEYPIENTRAHLWLGQAREATGDTKGACATYKVVVDRWGKAKPPSVTARDAAARIKAIGCP